MVVPTTEASKLMFCMVSLSLISYCLVTQGEARKRRRLGIFYEFLYWRVGCFYGVSDLPQLVFLLWTNIGWLPMDFHADVLRHKYIPLFLSV